MSPVSRPTEFLEVAMPKVSRQTEFLEVTKPKLPRQLKILEVEMPKLPSTKAAVDGRIDTRYSQAKQDCGQIGALRSQLTKQRLKPN